MAKLHNLCDARAECGSVHLFLVFPGGKSLFPFVKERRHKRGYQGYENYR
jgi:hypothetical protein